MSLLPDLTFADLSLADLFLATRSYGSLSVFSQLVTTLAALIMRIFKTCNEKAMR
jgi:hypothetical protein